MFTRIFSGFQLEPFLEAKNDLALREKLGIPADAFVIGKIARLFKLKGHDDLFVGVSKIVTANSKCAIAYSSATARCGRIWKIARAK